MYLTRRPSAAAAVAAAAHPTCAARSLSLCLRGLRFDCGTRATATAIAVAAVPSAAAAARRFSRHAAQQTLRPASSAVPAAPQPRVSPSQPSQSNSAQAQPSLSGPNGADIDAASADLPTPVSSTLSRTGLMRQLRELAKSRAPSSEVEALVARAPEGSWGPGALASYFEYYARVWDPEGAGRALAMFERRATHSSGAALDGGAYHSLLLCLLRDWKEPYVEVLDRLRARMMARSPPLRFSAARIGAMHKNSSGHPVVASRLLRWAEEDDMWNSLRHQKRESIALSAARDSPPAPSSSSNAPSSAAAVQVINRLHSLRSKGTLCATDIEGVMKTLSPNEWNWTVLHAYLSCYAEVAGSASALRTFERVSRQLGGVVPPRVVGLMCICLAKEWKQSYSSSIDLMRARMRVHNPPLSFDSRSLALMVPVMLAHKETAVRLQQWTAEDGSWEELDLEVQQQIAVAAAAQPTRQSQQHVSHSATAGKPNAPASSSSSSSASASSSAVAADPSYQLLQQLTQVLESENPFSADDIESSVTGIVSRAWTLDALHAYLRCYTEVAGAASALRTFELVTGELGRTPNVATFSLILQCMARDWRPQRAPAMDSFRARMLAQTPPLRFGASHIAAMLPLFAAQADTASRLQLWAQEDGAWSQLVPKMQRRIVAAVSAPASQQAQQTPSPHPTVAAPVAAPADPIGGGDHAAPSSAPEAFQAPAEPAPAQQSASTGLSRASRLAHLLHGGNATTAATATATTLPASRKSKNPAAVAFASVPAPAAAIPGASAPPSPKDVAQSIPANLEKPMQLLQKSAAEASYSHDLFVSKLDDLVRRGDWKGADRLVAEAEAQGMQLDFKVVSAWLDCYVYGPEWRGAEAVWKRMTDLGIAPTAVSYRQLMQVYMTSGVTEQVAKIDSLSEEMRSGSGPAGQPLHFSAVDLAKLIKTAHRCRLSAEARKWLRRSKVGSTEEGQGARDEPEAPVAVKLASTQASTSQSPVAASADPIDGGDRPAPSAPEASQASAEPAPTQQSAPTGLSRASRLAHLLHGGNAATTATATTPPVSRKSTSLAASAPTSAAPASGASAPPSPKDVAQSKPANLEEMELNQAAEAPHSRGLFIFKLVGLAKKGDWKEAERMVADAEAKGVQLDVRLINAWLSGYINGGEWRGAEKVWQRMAELALAPDSVSHRNLMQVYMSSGEADQLAKVEPLYAEMQNGSGPAGQPLHFSVRDFERLIKTAHRCRLVDEARRWSDRAKAAGVWEQLPSACHNILATVAEWEEEARLSPQEVQQQELVNRLLELAKLGDWPAAKRMVVDAEAAGVRLDLKAFNLWMACHERKGKWRGAKKVWGRMAELGVAPMAISYRTLMQVYMANGEAEQLAMVDSLWAELQSAGGSLQLSASDFERVIKSAHRSRLGDEARKWEERAKAAGLLEQLDESTQRILATVVEWENQPRSPRLEENALKNRLLNLTKQGDWAAAERLVAEAEASGVQLDLKAAGAWLGCYIYGGEWRGAEAVWKRMAELGIVPDPFFYRQLMQVYMANGEADQLAKVDSLWAEMQSDSGPTGQPLLFSIGDFERLIKTAHRCRLATEARKWAERVNAAGLFEQLDRSSRSILATLAEWEHQPRLSLQEEQQKALKKPLIELAKQGDWAAAERLVAEAEASGMPLDLKAAGAWLKHYERNGEWRDAEDVWKHMGEIGVVPTSICYRQLMQVYMINGEADQLAKIEPLYEEMQSDNGPAGQPLHFSAVDFQQLIETARRCRLGDEAHKWLQRSGSTEGVHGTSDEPEAAAAVTTSSASLPSSGDLPSSSMSSGLSSVAGSMASWKPKNQPDADMAFIAQQINEWWDATPTHAQETSHAAHHSTVAPVDSATSDAASAADSSVAAAEPAPVDPSTIFAPQAGDDQHTSASTAAHESPAEAPVESETFAQTPVASESDALPQLSEPAAPESASSDASSDAANVAEVESATASDSTAPAMALPAASVESDAADAADISDAPIESTPIESMPIDSSAHSVAQSDHDSDASTDSSDASSDAASDAAVSEDQVAPATDSTVSHVAPSVSDAADSTLAA